MCGIAGIFAYHYAANPIMADELCRMRDHMQARGPDAATEGIPYRLSGKVSLSSGLWRSIPFDERGTFRR